MLASSLLATSIALQLTAAIIALRLIRVTGWRVAWSMIALALLLVAARRSITFYGLFSGDAAIQVDVIAESVALIISALMVGGIAMMGPLLRKGARSEQEQRESDARLRGIMNNTADSIITIDEHGLVDSFNHAAELMFGYTAEEMRGRNVSILMPEPHHGQHDQYLKNYLSTGKGKILGIGPRELTGKRKDGTPVPIDLAVSEMRVGDTRLFVGVVRDITERKEGAKQLAQAQKMEAIGQLTGGIAHDFNNMLLAIIGNLELMSDHIAENSEPRRSLDVAYRAAMSAADLTKRLLAFSRRQPLDPTSADINQLILNTQPLLQRTLGEDIDFETVLGGGLWPAIVDESQLESAVLNLAINARDAMRDGGKLTLETANVRLDRDYAAAHLEVTPGQYVMVAVTDSGTGMAAEVIERAFEPFYTTKEIGKGSGLGLSMIYGFVKQSAGHVKIYSEVGHGTTVKIYLPRATGDEQTRPVQGLRQRPMPAGDERILVVEDDQDVSAFVTTALSVLGYSVTEAGDGPEAIALMDEGREFDLLFSDVVLPHGMNGRQIAVEFAKRYPRGKILFSSGYTENAIVHHGKLDDDAELLTKPYTREALARTVRGILDS